MSQEVNRPEPEVFRTPERMGRAEQEPVSVRVYTDESNSTVITLTPEEAGVLSARLLVFATRNGMEDQTNA